MEQIDYEKEVKKYYPDAVCIKTGFIDLTFTIYSTTNGISDLFGRSYEDEDSAWKDAYERLTKENDSLTDNCSEI